MTIAVINKANYQPITTALAIPYDQYGNMIMISAGNGYAYLTNATGTVDVPDTIDGYTVATVVVYADGFQSVSLRPDTNNLNTVYLMAGHDAPPVALSTSTSQAANGLGLGSSAIQQANQPQAGTQTGSANTGNGNVTMVDNSLSSDIRTLTDSIRSHMRIVLGVSLFALGAIVVVYIYKNRKG